MTTKVCKPRKDKIVRDIAIVTGLIYLSVFLKAGLTIKALVMPLPFVVAIGAIYLFITGILPYIRINDADELEFRSEYGITRRIKLTDIRKITKGSGVGGYEQALFVSHLRDGEMKKDRIKSSYFNTGDIVNLVSGIRKLTQVETNEELEDYLAGRAQ